MTDPSHGLLMLQIYLVTTFSCWYMHRYDFMHSRVPNMHIFSWVWIPHLEMLKQIFFSQECLNVLIVFLPVKIKVDFIRLEHYFRLVKTCWNQISLIYRFSNCLSTGSKTVLICMIYDNWHRYLNRHSYLNKQRYLKRHPLSEPTFGNKLYLLSVGQSAKYFRFSPPALLASD